MIQQVFSWLFDGAHWHGTDGIPARVLQHIGYCAVVLVIGAIIAVPIGAWIAHRGRGGWIITVINALRAVPSLGLLLIVTLWLQSKIQSTSVFSISSIIVLVVLAIPPLLAGAYSGVSEVDPDARDAARGMGMTGAQIFGRVELPCALPLMFSGLRSATLQVVATTTIAATVGIGGLGRYLIDGLAQSNYPEMAAGAICVAVLALLADLLLAAVQRMVVSPGLTGRVSRSRHTERPGDDEVTKEQTSEPVRSATP